MTACSTWGSAQGRALLGWIAIALVFWLGSTRLMEVTGRGVAFAGAAVLILSPLGLTLWAVLSATRDRGKWVAVHVTVGAWVVLLAAGIPLYRASIFLNFWAHRAAYDAVVADIKAGRLGSQPVGRRYGVTYNAPMMRRSDIGFVWYWDFDIGHGVAYDEEACPRPASPKRGPPVDASLDEPDGVVIPAIKDAGLGYKFHLGGHYCYFSVP